MQNLAKFVSNCVLTENFEIILNQSHHRHEKRVLYNKVYIINVYGRFYGMLCDLYVPKFAGCSYVYIHCFDDVG